MVSMVPECLFIKSHHTRVKLYLMSYPLYVNASSVQNPLSRDYNPQTGTTLTVPYQGSVAAMEALYTLYNSDFYRRLGYKVSIQHGAPATLVVTIPFDDAEFPIPEYEILGNKTEKSLLHSDLTSIVNISQQNKTAIEEYFKNQELMKNGMPSLANDATYSDALTIWLLMKDGVKSGLVFQPVLKKTYNCSARWLSLNPPAAITPAGAIHSTGTMQGVEGVPFYYNSSLPSSGFLQKLYSEKIANTNTYRYFVYVNFNYGWLKTYPTISSVAYNRVQVSVEYHYGLWPVILFGNLI